MIMTIGTSEQPLRVAIIGSGPSGFYAADHLQKNTRLTIEIDMFERLPTPYGLVRGGVAPDHAKIKSVTKVYDRIATQNNFRFYGHVNFGTDLTHADLTQHYHAIIYAVGAQTDRNLNIPGEDLAGSHAATEFVAWYNGHPDYRHLQFDLTQARVAVIGVGNVAMDVARILARTREELEKTDIADYALEALSQSNIREIYVLGRRGAAQAAFTNPEIKEMGELQGADVIVAPDEVELDPYSQALIDSGGDRVAAGNVQILRGYTQREPHGKPKRVIFRFLVSPTAILGQDRVEGLQIVKNQLIQKDDGSLAAQATDQTETLPVGLVFRSVGYRGVPLPGVPFHDKWGVIPNEKGRVLTAPNGTQVIGDYVVGWIKRGPSGIIGTNKPDSVETVEQLFADLHEGRVLNPAQPSREAVEALLQARHVQYVSFADWQALDEIEQRNGEQCGRPRLKFTRVEEMLEALRERQ
ncbi:MAG: FAD-dependent oxidoreductase [Anaerolineae bacterium]|nr:FAD-dependent oxidoreductase [Anaerolineae bacterium]